MEQREPSQHPDRLLLPYLENILSYQEKLMVEKHLQMCPECSQKTENLRHTIGLLRNTREAFCPELWELYAFARYRQDDLGAISAHVNECLACREVCEQWQQEVFSTEMPDQLHQRLKERFLDPTMKPGQAAGILSEYRARLSQLFRVPSLVGAAAGVAVLMLLILWPREIPQSVMAPSTVEWKGVSRPKAFQPHRQRIAIVLSLHGFPNPLPQKQVDSLYQAVAPDMGMFERFDFVTPAIVSEVVGSLDPPPRDTGDVLTILRTQLGVSRALVITVQSVEKGLEIESRLIDLAGPYSLSQQSEKLATSSDLEPRIKSIVHSFLSSDPAEREDASH